MSSLGELRTLAAQRHRRGQPKVKEKHPNNVAGYLFLTPWFIGFFVFGLIPLLASLYLSFTKYNLLISPLAHPPRWIGLTNYINMFNDPAFWNSFKVTVLYVVVGVPIQLTFALMLAVLLNRGTRGLSIYRAIFYLPSLMGGSVAVAILWRQVFGKYGLFNSILNIFGWSNPPGWIGDPNWALWTIVALHIWTFGSPMVIFLAGLRQIPEMYYEAATVDGASRVKQFFHITLPILSPIIFFNLVLQIIFACQTFTQAYVVSGGTGGPGNSTMFYTLYLYQIGFLNNFQMGKASAMAWFLLLVIAAFTALNFLLSKYWVFYDD